MNDHGKSDRSVVPEKSPNNDGDASTPAEMTEGRDLAKGNAAKQSRARAQNRRALDQALDRVRRAATRKQDERFTTLWHHVYNVDRLREAYFAIKRDAAAGVDRKTWRTYGEDLEENLEDLAGRLKRGAYRAQPVRRVMIPKGSSGRRPIGVPVVEDKIVQRATVEVLNAVYEAEFLGFSYGFRPGRRQHDALDALSVGLVRKRVNWVLDADIRGFFDSIDHAWLIKFVEHRIADRRVIRHIKKWLHAGVIDDGQWKAAGVGTPQGGSISPLLANITLHYVFDLWINQWRKRHAHGDVVVVRYADDFVVGFQHRDEAERCGVELRQRLMRFGLQLNEEKTRLIEFGRYAAERRSRRGEGKPETFNFLGFTHMCAKKRNGRFTVKRKTERKRVRRKLKQLRSKAKRRLHWDTPKLCRWIGTVLRGHMNYYAVPHNVRSISRMRYEMARLLRWMLGRKSQNSRAPWRRIKVLVERWLPPPRVLHPYPWERLRV